MKRIISIFLTLSLILPLGVAAQNQAGKARSGKQAEYKVTGKVVDAAGKPVAGAVIISMEGRDQVLAGVDGTFSAVSGTADYILIEAPGFQTRAVFIPDMSKAGGIITLQDLPMGTEQVTVAYGKFASERIAGGVSNIQMDEVREKYTSTNFWPLLPALVTGMTGNTTVRGMPNTVVVIDGLVRDGANATNLSSMITAEEIKEITVLKDAASRMLYGAAADSEIIMITTRRGQAFRREMNVTYDFGVGVPTSYPSYLKAADYMILNNEAKRNDNLTSLYSYEDIENTRAGIDPVKYPDVDYYRGGEFLSKVKPMNRVNAEFIGGNNTAQYYLNMGYYNTRSLLKAGEGSNQQTNRFNVKGAVDLKLTDFIKVGLDGTAIFNAYHGPKYKDKNFWNLTTSEPVNAYPLLIPIDRVRADSYSYVDEAAAQKALIDGKYLLGGTKTFSQNIYGDLDLGGYENTMDRFMNVNFSVDVDLKSVTQGLGFKTYFGSDNYNVYNVLQANEYAVYGDQNSMKANGFVPVKDGANKFTGAQAMNGVYYYRLLGWSNHLYYNRVFNEKHDLKSSLTSLMSSYKLSGQKYSYKSMNFGVRANYMYDRRYVAEYSGAYVGSQYLDPDKRWGYAQSIAGGWILSNEDFARDVKMLDYLKLKVAYANTKTDPSVGSANPFHAYENIYTISTTQYAYGGDARKTYPVTVSMGNPNLTWTGSHDVNAGFEALILNKSVWIEASYFNKTSYDRAQDNSAANPDYLGGSSFGYYVNSGKVRYDGAEVGLKYLRKTGDWNFNIGLNAVFTHSEVLEDIQIDYGPGMEYYQKVGKSAFANRGLKALGLYTQEEIDRINAGDPTIAKSSYATVRAGDIRYADMNNDGIINDYDMIVMGQSRPKAFYSLTLDVSWKFLNLFANFTARTGSSGSLNDLNKNYYWVYGSDMKYPSHLINRWAYDPSYGLDTRATATYPRLGDSNNNNNYQYSTYWKYNASYLTMPLLQLTYTLPQSVANAIFMKKAMVFLRGQNLFMVGPNAREMELNIASEPQLRWYYVGVKLEF